MWAHKFKSESHLDSETAIEAGVSVGDLIYFELENRTVLVTFLNHDALRGTIGYHSLSNTHLPGVTVKLPQHIY